MARVVDALGTYRTGLGDTCPGEVETEVVVR